MGLITTARSRARSFATSAHRTLSRARHRTAWWWKKNWDAVLDVAGLIAVPTGVWVLAGPGWALIAFGPTLIVTSWHLHRRPR